MGFYGNQYLTVRLPARRAYSLTYIEDWLVLILLIIEVLPAQIGQVRLLPPIA